MLDLSFYQGKRVLITGHTGFKGTWMCRVLLMAGAQVTGYALDAPTVPGLFELCKLKGEMNSVCGDVRDLSHLKKVFDEVKPQIVIHMAAQPIVREGYEHPVTTYETNVMGTVHVLECVRLHPEVRSFVNVTTDKVYKNKEWEWGYREDEELDGYDPYSNSKSCSELVTHCYVNSFLGQTRTAVSCMRAGNVIGGGDFAKDRIIPDCVRALQERGKIRIRNPYSIRPYQHVLEPVCAYLYLAMRQYENPDFAGYYNVGPDEDGCISTGALVKLFCDDWNGGGNPDHTKRDGKRAGAEKMRPFADWEQTSGSGPHEAHFLRLDCSRFKQKTGWRPVWKIETAVEKVVQWLDVYFAGGDINQCMTDQIETFLQEAEWG